MRNKIVLDTSFISAFYISDDVNHKAAVKAYRGLFRTHEFIIPLTVLIELAVFKNHIRKGLMIDGIIKDLNYSIEYLDKDFYSQLIRYLDSNPFTLKAIDATVIFIAQKYQAELLTFDKKLNKAWEDTNR